MTINFYRLPNRSQCRQGIMVYIGKRGLNINYNQMGHHEMDRASSVRSLTESTMSLSLSLSLSGCLEIILCFNSLDTVHFLGISIVGQSNKGGDGGIYVGLIMNGFVLFSYFIFCQNFCIKLKIKIIGNNSFIILSKLRLLSQNIFPK